MYVQSTCYIWRMFTGAYKFMLFTSSFQIPKWREWFFLPLEDRMLCCVVIVTQIKVFAISLHPSVIIVAHLLRPRIAFPSLLSHPTLKLVSYEREKKMCNKREQNIPPGARGPPVVHVANRWWQIFTRRITILKAGRTLYHSNTPILFLNVGLLGPYSYTHDLWYLWATDEIRWGLHNYCQGVEMT